jgi:molecular chaperone Hsp33
LTEKIHKFYSEDLLIRASAAITTGAVQKMCSGQTLSPIAIMGLGRALTGALLMASQLKEGQKVALTFHGDGPLGSLYAEASFEAQVRAYCHNGQADLPPKNGRLDVAGGIGQGVLTVVRSQPHQKQPHVGIVPIVSGEIGEDLAHYFFQSHQIPSVVSLSVSLDADGKVRAAGGVVIEVMPGATDKLLATLESRALSAGSLSQRLLNGESPLDFVKHYTHDSKLIAIDHPHEISYTCKCTIQRVERTLLLLGREAIEEMVAKGKDTSVQCQFCGRNYTVTLAELRLLQQQALFPNPVGSGPH